MIGDAESTMPLDQLDASPFSKSSKEMICSSTELEGQPPVKEGRDGCRLMLCDAVGVEDDLVGVVVGNEDGDTEGCLLGNLLGMTSEGRTLGFALGR